MAYGGGLFGGFRDRHQEKRLDISRDMADALRMMRILGQADERTLLSGRKRKAQQELDAGDLDIKIKKFQLKNAPAKFELEKQLADLKLTKEQADLDRILNANNPEMLKLEIEKIKAQIAAAKRQGKPPARLQLIDKVAAARLRVYNKTAQPEDYAFLDTVSKMEANRPNPQQAVLEQAGVVSPPQLDLSAPSPQAMGQAPTAPAAIQGPSLTQIAAGAKGDLEKLKEGLYTYSLSGPKQKAEVEAALNKIKNNEGVSANKLRKWAKQRNLNID